MATSGPDRPVLKISGEVLPVSILHNVLGHQIKISHSSHDRIRHITRSGRPHLARCIPEAGDCAVLFFREVATVSPDTDLPGLPRTRIPAICRPDNALLRNTR